MEHALLTILIVLVIALGAACTYFRMLFRESEKLVQSYRESHTTMSVILDEREDLLADATAALEASGSSSEELATAREELARAKEWHDKIIVVVMSERDKWRDLYVRMERDFDATSEFYQKRIAYLTTSLSKKINSPINIKREAEQAESDERRLLDLANSVKAEAASVERVEVSKNDKGFFVQERKALCLNLSDGSRSKTGPSLRPRKTRCGRLMGAFLLSSWTFLRRITGVTETGPRWSSVRPLTLRA